MVDKYKDKTILVLGGGTSTLDVKWENLDFDYVWTCNDFYLENRILQVPIDLYLLAYTTDLSNKKLVYKLKQERPTIIYEPTHYRGKQYSNEFRDFVENIGTAVAVRDIKTIEDLSRPALKSGAMFRLIALALQTEAKQIHFVGFDGFNKEFSNRHAFTKHTGLKDTDTRRDWTKHYKEVFIDAYNILIPFSDRLQNLGEGLDYNLGTEVSKKYFPLKQELYEKLK